VTKGRIGREGTPAWDNGAGETAVRDRVILHLDMDAFYAAIEQRERPELRGKPVLIGHPGPRGVVATCSYEARQFGIRSAMPSVRAMRLCPGAIWLPPDFPLYDKASTRIFALVEEAVPVVEQVSIDEAYGDLTGVAKDLADGAALARELKSAIRESERLTASAGVAACRFLAKVASDLEKPDGLVTIGPGDVERVLWPLSVRVIPGVGPKLQEHLVRLGARTVGDLAHADERLLRRELGAATAHFLKERARGEDDTPVEPWHERKQVSEERTYGEDLAGEPAIEQELFARADGIAAELRRRELVARNVAVKLRDADYRTITRSRTLDEPTDLAAEIYETARALWRAADEFRGRGLRLLGVAARDLMAACDVPPALFPDEQRERARQLARAADALRERFGDGAAQPARLVRKRIDRGQPP
jgi:DNA polymerase-4